MRKAAITAVTVLMVFSGVMVAGEAPAQAGDALAVIHARKSVRSYTDQPVTDSQIETLLRAAMAAPSGVDRRPWAFVVLTDIDVKNTLSERLPYAKMLASAPVAVVVCGDTDKDSHGLWQLDCAMAAENLLLAAEAIGLGAVYTAVYPDDGRMSAVNETLNLPANIVPLAVIPIGYPQGGEKPKEKWDPTLVHWQRWGGKAE